MAGAIPHAGEHTMGLLDGKVAIITGASKGIGRDMSQRFAAEGARVVCAARSAALVEETAELIRKAGGQAVAVVIDAATEEGASQAVTTAVKRFGRLDTLVNNAGDGGPTKPVQDYTTEDWFYTVNSCLTSSYMMTRFAVPQMIKAGGGAIIYISSVAGRRGLAYRIGVPQHQGQRHPARRRGRRSHRPGDRWPGRGAWGPGRADAQDLRRALAAQAHDGGRGHLGPGGLPVQ
jgi:NAD(P)-dependent dehydrogenase (short-subunit alcohol dehydrogenase family)